MTKKIRLYQPFGDLGCQRPAQDPRSIRKCNGKGGIVKVAIMLVVFTTSKRKAVVWACETDDLEKEKMYNITIVQSGFRQTN